MKIAILSLCVALLVGFFSLFQFEEFQKSMHLMQINLTKLENIDNQINPKLAPLRADLKALKQQIQNTAATLGNAPRTATIIEKIAEIRYLTFLADTRLRISKDVEAAITLLNAANETLQSFDNTAPGFQKLQEALRQDLDALKDVKVVNKEKLYLEVGMLIDKTSGLSPERSAQKNVANNNAGNSNKTVPNPEHNPATSKTTTTAKTEKNSTMSNVASHIAPWKEAFLENLQQIKDLVKIRQRTKPLEPLLSETEVGLVQQNLRSLLEEIRLAILISEEGIYQKALQNTKDWLTQYYESENPKVIAIQKELKQLADTHLSVSLPTLTVISVLNSNQADAPQSAPGNPPSPPVPTATTANPNNNPITAPGGP